MFKPVKDISGEGARVVYNQWDADIQRLRLHTIGIPEEAKHYMRTHVDDPEFEMLEQFSLPYGYFQTADTEQKNGPTNPVVYGFDPEEDDEFVGQYYMEFSPVIVEIDPIAHKIRFAAPCKNRDYWSTWRAIPQGEYDNQSKKVIDEGRSLINSLANLVIPHTPFRAIVGVESPLEVPVVIMFTPEAAYNTSHEFARCRLSRHMPTVRYLDEVSVIPLIELFNMIGGFVFGDASVHIAIDDNVQVQVLMNIVTDMEMWCADMAADWINYMRHNPVASDLWDAVFEFNRATGSLQQIPMN